MKKRVFNFGCTLALALGMAWNAAAQTTLTLNASNTVCTGSALCLNWTDSITGSPNADPSLNEGGGFWSETYGDNTGFGIGSFKLSHNSGFDIYSYWGGFTSGSNGDTRDYGFPDPQGHAGSVNWVPNQWGVMAGGGLNASNVATKGQPYLIAYWDYFSDGINPDAKSLQISMNGDSLFNLVGMYVCNHPWPFYGNYFGDGFARPLNQPGDHFDLIIHGVQANGTEATYTFNLARYSAYLQHNVYQSALWQKITFPSTSDWTNLKYIYFTMESTDQLVIGDTNYGPNTAVYFCMDKLTVTKTGGAARSAAAVRQSAKAPAAKAKAVEVAGYFPVKSYAGGDVTVYDAGGKKVLTMRVEAGEKINLSMLPAGEYRLQHGHKVIPVTKK